MTYSSVARCAAVISEKQVSVTWPKRFCKRHPDLKMKKTTGLEKAHAKALNRHAVNGFFDMLTEVIEKYGILPENLYNMDEKGLQLGIGARATAMINRDQKTAYSVEDGNRELVTVIETICADGSILHPSVIFQGVRRNSEWGRNNPCNARFVLFQHERSRPYKLVNSISISPNGWTDQELGIAWLRNDFNPATQDKAAGHYRLLILDGHNSHCTFSFCNYAADNKIIIICLPSHTTHALQPCDVGAFGPLAQSWKRVVTLASQSLIAIKKDNLLFHYHTACIEALKPTTIQSAFRKTGIWPVNREVIPLEAFEPSKNTTTQAVQPLSAHLPSILVPTPTPTPTPTPIPTPIPTPTPSAALHHDDADTLAEMDTEGLLNEEEPMERYHIEVPPPIPGTSSRQALRAENMMLRDIITQAGIALEEDYAQMKLMDLENERLRKRAFEKEKQKNPHKLSSGQARHMTAAEHLDLLAQQDWESHMKAVFKEAAPRFKVLKKNIADHQKAIENAKKIAEREAKKAAAKAASARRGRATGKRGGRRGRGARGRGVAVAGADDSDSDLELIESSESSSDSETESEAEIPIPRSRRPRPVRVIQGHCGVAADERN